MKFRWPTFDEVKHLLTPSQIAYREYLMKYGKEKPLSTDNPNYMTDDEVREAFNRQSNIHISYHGPGRCPIKYLRSCLYKQYLRNKYNRENFSVLG